MTNTSALPAPTAEEVKRLADDYAHCYSFVGDDTMPRRKAALYAAIDALSAVRSHPTPEETASRAMFVARIENMERNGDKWLTTAAVLALLNDCDMLAARPHPAPEVETGAAADAQPVTQEPLFLLYCGEIDSSGEQDEWDIEADSSKRVDEFAARHPGQTVKLYAAPPAQGAPAPYTPSDEEILAIVKAAPALDTAEEEWLWVVRAVLKRAGINQGERQ